MPTVKKVSVKTVALDQVIPDLNLRRIDLIKIDAESSEYFVIEGLAQSLSDYHPKVIVELGDAGVTGSSKMTKDILELMIGLNYKGFTCNDDGTIIELPAQDRYDYCNVLFVHRDQSISLEHTTSI